MTNESWKALYAKKRSERENHREKIIPMVDEQDGLTPFERFERLAKAVFSVEKDPEASKLVRL
jgi:hypothetical protein